MCVTHTDPFFHPLLFLSSPPSIFWSLDKVDISGEQKPQYPVCIGPDAFPVQQEQLQLMGSYRGGMRSFEGQ